MLSLFSGLSITTKLIAAGALVLAIFGVVEALKRQGESRLRNELQQQDNQTLKEKAKRDAEIRSLDDNDLVDRLTGDGVPK